MRSEWENDEIVEQFRDWLTRHVPRDPATSTRPMKAAMTEVRADAERSAAEWPATGLLQVVEALTAMRHELKLQTRNGRSLEESVQAARQSLDAAMRQFQSVQAREAESAHRAALPLIEALAGLDESLLRGVRALEITHRQLTETAPQQLRQMLDDEFHRLPWWRRWSVRAWHTRLRDHVAAATARVADEEFARVMEGYQLIQGRVQQELRKQGLQSSGDDWATRRSEVHDRGRRRRRSEPAAGNRGRRTAAWLSVARDGDSLCGSPRGEEPRQRRAARDEVADPADDVVG